MNGYFYSHLVELDDVVAELDSLEMTPEEKAELEAIAHSHLHQVIVDAILSELSDRDKKIFLANLEYDTHDKIWKHLNEKVDNVEDKIKDAAKKLKRELSDDVKQTKANS